MKISEQWLREWVQPEVSTAQLVEQLTMAGLEVDAVEPAAPAFNGIVVGAVTDLVAHPNADKLRVCTVDAGGAEPLQIVCGAPNVHVGMKAPVALIGAVLPGDFKIKKSKLRGVESNGMLCSARELGLSEDHAGLMPLPAAAVPGTDIRDYLQLDDQLIEVDLTPNRGDCLSVSGVAREVGVLNRCDLTPVATAAVEATIADEFAVSIEAPVDCPRYVGRVIRGVDAQAATPLWMQERLRRAGLRSLGPLVDVTNYVLLELGQPMHAFDLGKLSGGIVVRKAQAGETLELLNGSTIELQPEALVIADRQGPLALAGIMGGEQSACSDATRDVFLESAFFAPQPIAGRARRYGLHTDSSHRFERGVDPNLQRIALERATRLLLDMCGGQPGPVVECCCTEQLPSRPQITLRRERIRLLLGLEIADADIEAILGRLGMQLSATAAGWEVVAPSFRFDMAIEADLIEEIGRVYGYARLPTNRPLSRFAIGELPEVRLPLTRLQQVLIDRGYQEAITFTFVDPAFQAALDPQRAPVALANPISADLSVMRTTLWPGLVKALAYNRKRQQARVRLFETGLRFIDVGEGLPAQDARLGGAVCGGTIGEQWGQKARNVDFFDAKADVEALLAAGGQAQRYRFVAAEHPALHPGQSARIDCDGEPVGWLGLLHPAIEKQLDLDTHVYVFELALSALQSARVPSFAELSKFPAIRRDLAVVVNESISAQQVEDCIREYAGTLLRELTLFDVYRGQGIADGCKSLAFGLILQDFSRTLIDSDVDASVSGIVAGLAGKLSATLRV